MAQDNSGNLLLQMGPHAREGGRIGDCRRGPGTNRTKVTRVPDAGARLLRRVTYGEMASYWPSATHDYAAPMNEIPKVEFSKTLTDGTWEPSTVAGAISSRRSTPTPWFTSTSRPEIPPVSDKARRRASAVPSSNEPSAGTRVPLSAAANDVAPRGHASVRLGDPSSSGSAR